MSGNRFDIVITARDRGLTDTLRKSERSVSGFGRNLTGIMGRAGREIGRFGDRIGGLTTLLGGVAGVAAAKGVIDFDSRLARLSIQAGLTKQEMLGLKQELIETGDATYQGPEDLLAAVEQIVEKTGNFDFARKALKDMGVVASATGSGGGRHRGRVFGPSGKIQHQAGAVASCL